jgi:hypothetical protein
MQRELNLSEEEARLLATILLNERDATREEIRRTDNQFYKQDVQRREELIERILDQVQRSLHTVAT